MNVRLIAIAAVLVAFSASGCSKANRPTSSTDTTSAPSSTPAPGAMPQASGSDADAIRAAVEDHVRNDHSINMDVMEMTVDSVRVDGDQAHAEAAFRLKQGGTGMAMTYFLARQANGWVVTRSQPSDGQFMHPPTDGAHPGMAPNSGAPGMPDVTDFLKNHPPVSKN